jgi:hypothetical protein
VLYQRLNKKQRATLLQILAKRIIVDADGEMKVHELHTPFEYLVSLSPGPDQSPNGRGSNIIRLGPSRTIVPRSPTDSVEEFLASLRFEHRHRLEEIPLSQVE